MPPKPEEQGGIIAYRLSVQGLDGALHYDPP